MGKEESLDYQKPCIKDPILLPEKLLAGAGPSNCSPRVLHAMSRQTRSIVDQQLFEACDDIIELLQYVFQTKNKMTFLHQTSGTGGLEMAIINLLNPGQKILVAVGGVWGHRAAEIAEVHHMNVVKLEVCLGGVFSIEYLEEQIKEHKPDLLFITHGESSHGTLQSLEGLGDICKKNNCLFVVDCIVTIGATPFFTDRWGIDVAIGASQKALGCPPGMALLTFSPKAEKIVMTKKIPPSVYHSIKGLSSYWGFEGKPKTYYYSYNSNMMFAVREALLQIQEEGLEAIWARHSNCHDRFIEGCQSIGVSPLIKDDKIRLTAVTTLLIPEGIAWQEWLKFMLEKYNIEAAFGIGLTANKAIRIGIMGYNARPEVVDYILQALEDGLQHCRCQCKGSQTTQLK